MLVSKRENFSRLPLILFFGVEFLKSSGRITAFWYRRKQHLPRHPVCNITSLRRAFSIQFTKKDGRDLSTKGNSPSGEAGAAL